METENIANNIENTTENTDNNTDNNTDSNTEKSIVIYSTPTCHFCQIAKAFFKEHNLAYTEFDVAVDQEKRQEMLQRSGQMGVPVIFIGEEMIVGFDKEKLMSLLNIPK